MSEDFDKMIDQSKLAQEDDEENLKKNFLGEDAYDDENSNEETNLGSDFNFLDGGLGDSGEADAGEETGLGGFLDSLDELSSYESQEEEQTGIESNHGGSLDFAIIGLGQAGGRLAEEFYILGYKKTIVINTSYHDLDSLKHIPNEHKIKLGNKEGAGKDIEYSRQVLLENVSDVVYRMKKIFGRKIDGILVCAGSGGGTGCGMILPMLEISNRYMKSIGVSDSEKKVGAIVAIPTNGELASPVVKGNTLNVLPKLSNFADAGKISPLIIIDNEKAKKLFSKVPVTKFYPFTNKMVINTFHMFNKISTVKSDLISFDIADYENIIRSSGHMIFGVISITEKDLKDPVKLSKALKENLDATLLARGFNLLTAKVVGTIIIGEKRLLDTVPGLMDLFEDVYTTISHITGDSVVHRGLYADRSIKGIKILIIIGGMEKPVERFREIERF